MYFEEVEGWNDIDPPRFTFQYTYIQCYAPGNFDHTLIT